VEVWIDGKWLYLGACEPEPDLNIGWFDEPSRRTMLVHTRTYGRFFGDEEVVVSHERFSELNLTANYSAVKDIFVRTIYPDGTAADSARVEFRLYNYAEYYPIATAFGNQQGITRLKTGIGDLLIWASKNGRYGYRKFSVPETDTLTLVLDADAKKEYSENLDMVPPHTVKVEVKVTDEQRTSNNRRLAQEDSIRNNYMATFKDSAWASAFASKMGFDSDTLRSFIFKSYGNWDQISFFLEKNRDNSRYLLSFARQISDKDLSDTPEPVLTDHFVTALNQPEIPGLPKDIFMQYVLSPRISTEILSPWRSFLLKEFGNDFSARVQGDISVLTNWMRQNIVIDDVANLHSRAPITPSGVYNLGVTNSSSRDIFFVAACRTFGIPARLNPATLVPEYWKNGRWMLAGFEAETNVQPVKGTLRLVNGKNPVEPQYYLHFTIAKIESGICRTLEFEEGKNITSFESPVQLDTGRYVLVTGNRLEDGTVLSSLTFFNIAPAKSVHVPVELRKLPGSLKSSGKLDFSTLKITTGEKPKQLSNLVMNRNAVIMLIDPDKEPSKHILNDLGPYVDHFNQWQGIFIVAMPKAKSNQAGVLKTYVLPQNLISGIDMDDNLLNALIKAYGDGLKDKLPLVMVSDNKGNIYLFSAGYKIGMGEQILRITPVLTSVQSSCEKP
jgi:hypothetical protein